MQSVVRGRQGKVNKMRTREIKHKAANNMETMMYWGMLLRTRGEIGVVVKSLFSSFVVQQVSVQFRM